MLLHARELKAIERFPLEDEVDKVRDLYEVMCKNVNLSVHPRYLQSLDPGGKSSQLCHCDSLVAVTTTTTTTTIINNRTIIFLPLPLTTSTYCPFLTTHQTDGPLSS